MSARLAFGLGVSFWPGLYVMAVLVRVFIDWWRRHVFTVGKVADNVEIVARFWREGRNFFGVHLRGRWVLFVAAPERLVQRWPLTPLKRSYRSPRARRVSRG